MLEIVYTDEPALRVALGFEPDDEAALPDEVAASLLRRAERLVDTFLGVRGVYTTGPSAGRKVAESDVEAYVWTEIGEATALVAAMIFNDPGRFDRTFDSVSGPDFSTSGPSSSPLGIEVESILNGTGLVRRTARGTA